MSTLNTFQQNIVDIINIRTAIASESTSYYIKEFRTFEFRVPRSSGKTTLIQHLAENMDFPIIVVANQSVIASYPKHLRPYCYTPATVELGMRGKKSDAMLVDEVKLDIDLSFVINKDFYYLRLYT